MAIEDIAEALVMPCVGGDTWLQSLVSFVLVARRVPQLYALEPCQVTDPESDE